MHRPTLRPVRDPARRRLLRYLAAGPTLLTAGLAAPVARAVESFAEDLPAPRALSLVSTHTGERLAVRYFEDGAYLPAALQRLNHVLRDHRSGEVAAIDPLLLDQLHLVALRAGCEPSFEIISGYRSPATNEKLRKASTGVATRSLHMDGRAIDVRLKGCRTARLHELALGLKAGGVGYYAKSDFVHLDTGRVRAWTG